MQKQTVDVEWDDGNRKKCQKHRVSISEIEHVLARIETFLVSDDKNTEYEPRFIAIGRNPNGRYVFVAFTPRVKNDRPLWRPISARYMHKKEIARYEKESSGIQDR